MLLNPQGEVGSSMVSSGVFCFFCHLAYTFGSFSYGRTLVRNTVIFLVEENY
jgi:hypothetical protein